MVHSGGLWKSNGTDLWGKISLHYENIVELGGESKMVKITFVGVKLPNPTGQHSLECLKNVLCLKMVSTAKYYLCV
jgi:hypothetical protein